MIDWFQEHIYIFDDFLSADEGSNDERFAVGAGAAQVIAGLPVPIYPYHLSPMSLTPVPIWPQHIAHPTLTPCPYDTNAMFYDPITHAL